jgi:putative endonuclease
MTKNNTDMKAETAASLYLEMRGYKVLERNWHRSKSKIDIIASKDNAISFVDIKYKAHDSESSTVEALTTTQLLQLQKAAWTWVDETKWNDKYIISSIEVAGPDYVILSFTENII